MTTKQQRNLHQKNLTRSHGGMEIWDGDRAESRSAQRVAGVWLGVVAGMAALCGATGAAWAETTKEVVGGQYVVTVPRGEVYTLTAADVAELGSYDFVKSGEGTLTVGSAASGIAAYAGTIRITEGVYDSYIRYGAGSESAKVYVDGGTFQNSLRQGGAAIYPGEMHFKGTGYNDGTKDLGAFRTRRNISHGLVHVVLDGDALFTTGLYLADADAPFAITTTFDMNGHTLTFRGDADVSPVHAGLSVSAWSVFANLGNLVIDHARLSIGAVFGDDSTSLTFRNGAILDYVKASGAVEGLKMGGVRLVLGDATTLRVQTETAAYSQWGYNNNWWGPVTVEGRTTVTNLTASSPGSYIGFAGKVTGPGGFDVKGGAKVIFYDNGNDFAGDLTVEGVAVEPGTTVKDVASGIAGGEICGTLGAVIGVEDGSIPTNAGQKVVLTNGHFIHSAQKVLPAVVSSGTGVVYSPSFSEYAIPELTGCPVFTNGTATLTGAWKIRPEDVAAGVSLTVLGGTSAFYFGADATVALTDEAQTAQTSLQLTKGAKDVDHVRTNGLDAEHFRLKKRNGDLWLVPKTGLCLILK